MALLKELHRKWQMWFSTICWAGCMGRRYIK